VRVTKDDAHEVIRQRLRLAIEQSASEAWSPWYVRGHVPDDQADLFADIALRRWRSRARRSLGRRDPVRDLAHGFSESRGLHPPGSMPIASWEKDDYYALAIVLEAILREGEG
jgi:hypothetical protein